jgi:ketosteroid isomerase-like protein
MSQENVEMVADGINAFNRRDLDALAGLMTTDCAWFPAMPGIVAGDSYRGRAGLEAYLVELASTWDALRIVAEECRDLGDHVLVLGRLVGQGRGSGAPVETPIAVLQDFREGKISRVRAFLDPADAVEALELAE